MTAIGQRPATACDTIALDLSVADLSRVPAHEAKRIVNVIRTPRTTWPPGTFEEVRTRSHRLRPDIFRITVSG